MLTSENQSRKQLASDAALAMVSAIVAGSSPRIDAFSTWLLGATAGFLVLLVTDIARTITVLKTGPVKAIILILMVSAVMGLIQKVLAMLLQLDTEMTEASIREVAKTVETHAGEQVLDPVSYLRQHVDVSYMYLLFVGAFPKWMQKRIPQMIHAGSKEDLSDLQNATKRLLWQGGIVVIQVFSLLATFVIVLFNL